MQLSVSLSIVIQDKDQFEITADRLCHSSSSGLPLSSSFRSRPFWPSFPSSPGRHRRVFFTVRFLRFSTTLRVFLPAIYLFQPRLLQFPKMLNGGFGKKSRKEEAGGGVAKEAKSLWASVVSASRATGHQAAVFQNCVYSKTAEKCWNGRGKKTLNKLNCHKLSG